MLCMVRYVMGVNRSQIINCFSLINFHCLLKCTRMLVTSNKSDTFQTTLRIWDCLLYEGPKILLRVASMLIIQNSEKLIACRNFSEAMDAFKVITKSAGCVNCHDFLRVSYIVAV